MWAEHVPGFHHAGATTCQSAELSTELGLGGLIRAQWPAVVVIHTGKCLEYII
jgi:hypothetical protein